MTTLEIILSVVTVICSTGNIAQFVSLRAIRKESTANASKAADEVLYRRFKFLEDRVTALENLACYRSDCHRRFNLATTPLEHTITSEYENIP